MWTSGLPCRECDYYAFIPNTNSHLTYFRLDNPTKTFLSNGQEAMTTLSRTACLDGNVDTAVGAVLEASGHGQGRH